MSSKSWRRKILRQKQLVLQRKKLLGKTNEKRTEFQKSKGLKRYRSKKILSYRIFKWNIMIWYTILLIDFVDVLSQLGDLSKPPLVAPATWLVAFRKHRINGFCYSNLNHWWWQRYNANKGREVLLVALVTQITYQNFEGVFFSE